MDRATHEKSQPSRRISSSPHRDSARAISKTAGDSLLSVFQRLTGCPTGTIQRTRRKWLEHDVTAPSGFRRRETHDVHDCLSPEAPLLQGFHSPSSLLHSCCRRGPSGRRERLEQHARLNFHYVIGELIQGWDGAIAFSRTSFGTDSPKLGVALPCRPRTSCVCRPQLKVRSEVVA